MLIWFVRDKRKDIRRKFEKEIDIISKNDASKLRQGIYLRNNVVHGMKELSIKEAKYFVDFVKYITDNYLNR
ncbi:hypothetical protein DRO66_08460 [Candidatus Bathyarchaeota archaeon]|nr:MAG: hypothetical protein DRO66_08460 [Candidatus Bathyarchaeota archaeon]